MKMYMRIRLKHCEVRVFGAFFFQVVQTQFNSIKGKLSYSDFYQPGIRLIVFSGEMRENESNLTIRSNYSKRKMSWVIIAAKLMGVCAHTSCTC